jgi:REP element-mobilizing transposase RayT
MDRYWFFTWTTYGTWLPGDDRGFVSDVRSEDGPKVRHNQFETELNSKRRGLELHAKKLMKGSPVFLGIEQSQVLWEQFGITARARFIELIAGAIMGNHVHLVVGVGGDPDPQLMLGDFKSYGSRALNSRFGKPKSGTWWTQSGSCRRLKNQDSVNAAVEYVKNQEFPLFLWVK